QAQLRQRRQVGAVVPPAAVEACLGWRLHAGAGALDARLGQDQARILENIVLLPFDFLDRVGPGESEMIGRQADGPRTEDQTERGCAKAAHATLATARRVR